MKGATSQVNVPFDQLRNTQNTNHFGFSFKTKNLNDLLGFSFYLNDSNNKGIEFIDDEKKIVY